MPLAILVSSVLESQVLLAIFVFAYSAHAFLTVLVETAAGNDEITWSDDSWHARFAHFCYLGVFVGVWIYPTFLLLRYLEQPLWLFGVTAFLVLWLVMPLSLLSSLSGPSQVLLLRPGLVWAALRRPGALLTFYAVTGVLFVGAGVFFGGAVALGTLWFPEEPEVTDAAWLLVDRMPVDWVVFLGALFFLPAAAVTLSAAVLVYARLLGRIGLLVCHGKGRRRGPAPSIIPLPTAPAGFDEPPGPMTLALEAGPSPIAVLPLEPSALRQAAVQAYVRESRLELRLALPSRKPRPPRYPMLRGVYSFLLQPRTRRAWFWLSVGNTLIGFLIWVQVHFWV